jgi:hypothetical protein
MTSAHLKAIFASYWRYVRQCPVVALEANSSLRSWGGELADILSIDTRRMVIETEIKVSLSDLKRDGEKLKHWHLLNDDSTRPTNYFYFAVPQEIANAARLICDDVFPYAGLLATNCNEWNVQIYKVAKRLKGCRLSSPQILRILYEQSGTVCRLANKVDELTRVRDNMEKQLKEYYDYKRLMEVDHD